MGISLPGEVFHEGLTGQLPLPVQERTPPSFGDVFEADFWRNNTVGSTISFIDEISQRMDAPEVPGYDALGDISGYEEQAGAFINSRSPQETQVIKSRIDFDREAQATIAAGGWREVVSGLLNGVVDPTTFIPVIGWEIKGATLGTRLLSGASRGVIGGAEAGVASEAILQSTQPDRPVGESLQNILAYSVLGGVLGGGLSLMGRPRVAAAMDDIQRDFTAPHSISGGAAAADVRTQEGLMPRGSGLDWFMTNRVTGNPVSRGIRSPFLGIQRATADLADTPEHLRTEGTGVPVTEGGSAEARMKQWYGLAGRADAIVHDQYRLYRQRIKTEGGKPMNRENFATAVTQSTHREEGIGLPEADKAAADIRSHFYDPALKAGQETGLLSKNLVAPGDYGHRVWDHDRIATNRSSLVDKIEEHVRGLKDSPFLANLQEKVNRLAATIEAKTEAVNLLKVRVKGGEKSAQVLLRAERVLLDNLRNEHALLKNRADDMIAMSSGDTEEIRKFSNAAVNHIQIGTFGRGLTSPELRGGFKFRLLDFIPNAELEQWLDLNIAHVLGHYTHFIAPDVELARKFGSPSLEERIAEIEEDAAAHIDASPAGQKPQLEKDLKSDIEGLKALRDVMRNVYALPKTVTGARTMKFLLNAGLLRAGGSFLVSSIPDVARPATIFGMQRFFGQGLPTFLTRLKSPEMRETMEKITSDLRDMGAANELLRNERMLSFANAFVDYSHMSRAERAVQWMTDRYGKVSGMSYWNQYFKQMSGILSVNRTLDDAARLAKDGKLDEKSQRRLDFLGISPELAIQIAEQFGKHGETLERLKNANWSEWSNEAAKTAFQAAVVKDVERTILTPGLSRPLWMNTPTGRLVGQFRSFTAESMNKIVVAGLQERDAAQLSGLAFNIIMGGMVFVIKQALRGAAGLAVIDGLTGESFLTNALDQSGIGGWFFEVNNVLQKVSGRDAPNWLHLAAGDDKGSTPISRYSVQQGLSSLLGPTVRAANEIGFGSSGLLMAATSDEDVKLSDVRRLKSNLIPYQNLWWIRVLIDQVQNATGDESGTLEALR